MGTSTGTKTVNKRKKREAWKIISLAVVSAAALLVAVGWTGFSILIAKQDISLLEKPLPAPTIIYDQQEKEASKIASNTFEPVTFDRLPKHLIDAVVAVEDKRFFEHDGTDAWGIGRALLTNLTSGKTVQGASTITQQLAKNVFLTHDRTWTRKWNEALLAKKIEESYDKQQIITMYLNQIYFGEGAWGIKRAAQTYFGKQVQELTVSESALLAGIIRAPSALSPFKHPEKAKERRSTALQLMKEQGKISPEKYEAAMLEPLRVRKSKASHDGGIKYPYYVDQIVREASELYGLTENEVLHGGLRIYTALDPRMQEAAERVYANETLFPESKPDQLIQSGAVLVDPRDGGIKAVIGGRGKQPFRGFNRAVQLKRQPGSTMKPIAVYTPAFEKGYSPSDTLWDVPTDFGGYEPKNAGGGYHGEVTIYDSIVNSYNIPAVQLLNDIGIDAGMEASARFGIELTDADRTLGLALGGLQEGVSPLDMAEAYGVFANDGVRMPAHSILRIESADGIVLAEAAEAEENALQTTDASIASTMTEMLEGVVREGTGEAAALPDRPVAGKSGTTEVTGGNKDNWFVGYTPQLVGAVWLGYDHTDATHYLTTSSKAAAAVFHELMGEALKGEPVMAFPGAPGYTKKKKDRDEEDWQTQENSQESDKEEKEREKEERKREKEREKQEDKADRGHGKGKDKEKGKGKRDEDEDNDGDEFEDELEDWVGDLMLSPMP
ncbi:transglycosylase domain-containing protein [Paenibacillus montanisoli]|uniref:Penicillin-binding protein n=1 Tax=Paenibacillus montanisoli TaxID=2081970 RepID=A0A328U3Z4_9BACL|nr:PBP1A family penicillin-binding protein [Paenibacillus montanisoli]RAP77518.1 penicillin-binding protein [Paenibacillus montanisoli]